MGSHGLASLAGHLRPFQAWQAFLLLYRVCRNENEGLSDLTIVVSLEGMSRPDRGKAGRPVKLGRLGKIGRPGKPARPGKPRRPVNSGWPDWPA